MGRYYLLHEGGLPVVADAIEQHYRPRFAGDALPAGNIACAAALADKLDALVGFFGIGQLPTGDKDPFGLRRAALGVLRILMETPLPLDLGELIGDAKGGAAACREFSSKRSMNRCWASCSTACAACSRTRPCDRRHRSRAGATTDAHRPGSRRSWRRCASSWRCPKRWRWPRPTSGSATS
jgi:hypothetical protein